MEQEKSIIERTLGNEKQIFIVNMMKKELKKIINELGSEWMIYLVKAREKEDKKLMGPLAECKPPWYTIDRFFREDVIADNLRLAYRYKLKNN